MADENKTYLEVISYIKEGLKSGELKTGRKLPAERVMAETLGMSRNSIREALRTLDNMGIIECRQGSGNYLQGRLGNGLSEALSMHLMMDMVSYRDANSLRRAAEMESFERIFDYNLEFDRDYLRSLIKQMDEQDIAESAEADKDFHMHIIESGSNTLLICMAKAVMEACSSSIRYNLKTMPHAQQEESRRCHHEIYKALLTGDMETGKKAIKRHYEIVDENLRRAEQKYA